MTAQKGIVIIAFVLMCIGTFFLVQEASKPEPKKVVPFTLPEYDSEFPTRSPSGYSLQCSRVFEPVCAEVENIKTTFPNECAMRSKGGTKLFDGSCEDQVLTEKNNLNRRYISESVEDCSIKEWSCEDGEMPFSDDQGCGCESIPMPEIMPEKESSETNPEAASKIVEKIIFEGCPEILSRNTCPPGYEKFEEGEECGCKK